MLEGESIVDAIIEGETRERRGRSAGTSSMEQSAFRILQKQSAITANIVEHHAGSEYRAPSRRYSIRPASPAPGGSSQTWRQARVRSPIQNLSAKRSLASTEYNHNLFPARNSRGIVLPAS